MTGQGHATAAPRRVRKSRRLMTNLRVDPLHFSPEPRWRALAPTGASQVPAATASGSFGTCRRGRVRGAPLAPTRGQDLSFENPPPLPLGVSVMTLHRWRKAPPGPQSEFVEIQEAASYGVRGSALAR